MTRKQRARLDRNRDSQRAAFAEHCAIVREFGTKHIEGAPHRPERASRRISGDRPFNAYLRLPKNAA